MTLFCSSQEFDALCRDLDGKADILRLQAKGGSMFPCIRSGDWMDLRLIKGKAKDIDKGDIILFTKDKNLFLHRVLRKKEEGFVAKGDMSFGHDGVIAYEDILAKVVLIERGARKIDLSTRRNRLIAAISADASAFLQTPVLCSRKMFGLGMSAFFRIQSFKVYRWFAKKILSSPVSVRPAVPEDEEALRDLYLMSGQDIKEGLGRIAKEGFWLVAERKNKIVAGLTVSRAEQDVAIWIIFGLEVKPWLRGLGIGERLVEQAVKKVKEEHGSFIGLFVHKKSTPALGLYRKLGFDVTYEIPAGFNISSDEFYLSKKIHE